MPDRPRLVADTNVLVSRLLSRHSVASQAMQRAMAVSQLIVSSETLQELEAVLSRPKFDPYLTLTDRLQFFHRLRRASVQIDNVPTIAACRDPKDDKFWPSHSQAEQTSSSLATTTCSSSIHFAESPSSIHDNISVSSIFDRAAGATPHAFHATLLTTTIKPAARPPPPINGQTRLTLPQN